MTPPSSTATARDQDAQLTAHRREDKYLLSADAAKAVAAAANRHLTPHRFRGDGANLLPGARHFVTTIYFDTPSRELFHAAHGHTSTSSCGPRSTTTSTPTSPRPPPTSPSWCGSSRSSGSR